VNKIKGWSKADLKLLGRKSDSEVARLTGRPYKQVWATRKRLGIPQTHRLVRNWTAAEDRVVEAKPVKEAARILGRTEIAVIIRRRKVRPKVPRIKLLTEQEALSRVRVPRYESKEHENLVKFVGGPYRPPKLPRGGFLKCAVRGKTRVCGYSNGLIPWPVSWRHPKQLIVCGDLLEALRRESVRAIVFHFGISHATASKLRTLLGIERYNAGSMRLFWRNVNLARTDEARKKMSRAREGKPSRESARDRERLRRIQRRPKPEVWKRKMSALWQKRFRLVGRPKRWTKQELAMIGTRPDREVARMLGRSVAAVRAKKFAKQALA
jgi:hypothetical protein